jgi:hypothetical protein
MERSPLVQPSPSLSGRVDSGRGATDCVPASQGTPTYQNDHGQLNHSATQYPAMLTASNQVRRKTKLVNLHPL